MRSLALFSVDQLIWPWIPLGLVGLGLLLAGTPEELEGPTFVTFGSGHGLTEANVVALIPLLPGCVSFFYGLWSRRATLAQLATSRPLLISMLACQFSVGFACLLTSGVSTYFWWWTAGSFLSMTALLAISLLVVTQRLGAPRA